jgi:hypothetical protein
MLAGSTCIGTDSERDHHQRSHFTALRPVGSGVTAGGAWYKLCRPRT